MPKYSFEEVKMLYESAEKVTDRRISLSKYNTSLCLAIIVAIALFWKWSLENPKYLYCGMLMIALIALLAWYFCLLWKHQIFDYKALNAAKFDVINEMSKDVTFDCPEQETSKNSFEPFAKEWDILSKSERGLAKHEELGSAFLPAGVKELFMPKAFKLIFTIISITTILIVVFNFKKTINSIILLLQPS